MACSEESLGAGAAVWGFWIVDKALSLEEVLGVFIGDVGIITGSVFTDLVETTLSLVGISSLVVEAAAAGGRLLTARGWDG